MKKETYLFIITFILLTNLTFGQRLKTGINLYIEYQDVASIGTGLRIGKNMKVASIPNRKQIKAAGTAFQGVVLKYDYGINQQLHKVECLFVQSGLFLIGAAPNWIRYQNENRFGIKPVIGLSLYNFEAYYSYNISLFNKSLLSKNAIGLGYRFYRKRKKTKQ